METDPAATSSQKEQAVVVGPQASLDHEVPAETQSADLPTSSLLGIRSRKRKSVLPANLKALRTSVTTGGNSPESNSSVESPSRSLSSELDTNIQPAQKNHFSSNLPEPIAKRLRARGTAKPAYFPTARVAKKARSVSEDKIVSAPPADSPVSDFDFTGSSVRHGAVAAPNQPLPGDSESTALKGILKRGVAAAAKHLAFVDEGVEERQALAESRRVEVESVPAVASPITQKNQGLIPGRIPNLKIFSWNIAGLRAFIEKNTWREINTLLPDVICLQETKVQSNDLFESLGVNVGATHAYWHHSATKGHAGVAILSKAKPLQVMYGLSRPEGRHFADKGHVITAEYTDFFLVNVYVPNSSAMLKNLEERLEWDKDLRRFLADLQVKKPVVVAGDLNCALEEMDLTNPSRNQKNPGFTPQERANLACTLKELKMIDVFRRLNPDTPGCYTFWSTRTASRPKNVGWRLDYFLVSEALVSKVCGVRHYVEVMGSDHCPIMLYLETATSP